MANVMVEREQVVPWWEKAKAHWRGKLFDEAILQPTDGEEQRIQRIRADLARLYRARDRRISTTRARLLTEAYRATEGESPAMRLAIAYDSILRNIPVAIPAHQLLAGTASSGPGIVEIQPEYLRIQDLLAGQDGGMEEAPVVTAPPPYTFPEEEKRVFLEEIWPYWKDRCRGAHAIRELRRHYPEAWFYTLKSGTYLMPYLGSALLHTLQDYASIVARGLEAIEIEIRRAMESLDAASPTDRLEGFERRNIYQAMLICADATIAYADRCAVEAERLAQEERDAVRKAELLEMARICRKVPRGPAESWWEALQALHILHTATSLLQGGTSHGVGRLDQWIFPYLRNDLESGTITLKKAQELLECLFLKRNETIDIVMTEWSHATPTNGNPGRGNIDKIVIGGVDSRGNDASNLLTFMVLEACAHVHLNDPTVSLRVHPNTPDNLLLRALEVVRLGGGIPLLINDTAIIGAMLSAGVSLPHARNYADLGCQENVIDPNTDGEADCHGRTNAGWFNLVKPIELAMFNGVNPYNGEQVGPRTGDPAAFADMERFLEAVGTQFEHAAQLNAIVNNVADYVSTRYFPCIYHDLMHPGPRKSGVDINAGGCMYNWTGHLAIGTANAGDILAAIDHLIYRTGQTTWPELLSALRANWNGYDALRRQCIAAPKYGADDEYADGWTKRALDMWFDSIESKRTGRGGRFVGGLISMAHYVALGATTGATPDGRVAGERLADSVGPSHYAPVLGPAPVHRSVARAIDGARVPNGVTFNQRINLGSVTTERELNKWADLIRAYFDAGGVQVQYSVLDRQSLARAKLHPEEYPDLMVRVGGYSALFADLSPELQDSIIARAELEIG